MIQRANGRLPAEVRDLKPDGLRAAVQIVDFNTARSFQTFVDINNHYEGSAPITVERFLRVLRGIATAPGPPANAS